IKLGRDGDAKVAAWARNPGSSPALSLKSRMDTTRVEEVRVEQLTPLTDSSVAREPGLGMRQRTGITKMVRMPIMASFTPTLTSTLPFGYAFDEKTAKALLPILKIHGIAVDKLDAAASVTAQGLLVEAIGDSSRSETPRMLRAFTGRWNDAATRSLPAGSYVVRAGQPYGLAAFYLLEPESEDGLARWSFLDNIMAAGAEFPVVRITKPATLRSRVVRD